MAYEAGTTIIFDVIGKTVFIVFRDIIITLPGPYASQEEGIAAGEAYCRSWDGGVDEG